MRSSSLASRLTVGMLVLSFAAAFAFGALIKTASADHYHNAGFCGAGNGMVHGTSTADGAYHGRVEMPGSCPANYKYCDARHFDYSGPLASDESQYEGCNAFVQLNQSADPECAGYAYVYFAAVFDGHFHYAHNRCF